MHPDYSSKRTAATGCGTIRQRSVAAAWLEHQPRHQSMRRFRAGLVYFALVFGAGFALGSIRVLLLVPRLGVRYAELLEMPFMFFAVLLCARYTVARYRLPAGASVRFSVGFIALALLLAAELLLNTLVLKQSLTEYIAARDPISGAAYLVMLGLFAVMPWLVHRSTLGGRA